jgi:hypothetical protein
MELNETTFEQVHAYLRGDGTAEERKDFERQMQQNSQLAEELETQRRIKSGLKANAHRQRFADIHAQLKADGTLPQWETPTETVPEVPIKPLKSNPQWHYWAAAASVVLLVGVGWYVISGKSNKAQDTIALSENTNTIKTPPKTATSSLDTGAIPAKPPKPIVDKPGATSPARSPDYKALFAENFSRNPALDSPFSKERFGINPSMIARWQADTTALRAGIRLLNSGLGRSALVEFQKVEKSRFDDLRQHGEWYVTLALLWQSDYGQTRQRLQGISTNEAHLYQARAKKLLAKIEHPEVRSGK